MYIDERRVLLKYELPLAEVVEYFYDEVRHLLRKWRMAHTSVPWSRVPWNGQVKSISSGYATFDYEEIGYKVRPGWAREGQRQERWRQRGGGRNN